jgi:signal transduction histidine kinase
MSLKQQILLAAVILLMTTLTIVSVLIVSNRNVSIEVARSEEINKIIHNVFELEILLFDGIFRDNNRAKDQFNSKYQKYKINLSELQKLETEEEKHILNIQKEYDRIYYLYTEILEVKKNKNQLFQSESIETVLENRLAGQILARSQSLLIQVNRLSILLQSKIKKAQQSTYQLILIGCGLLFFILLSASMYLIKRMIGPLLRLESELESAGDQILDHKFKIHSNDELGKLARAFNRMIDRVKELTTSRDSLHREIAIKREAQTALKKANIELQNFSYLASHDLKTPLRGISSLADWLKEDYSGVLDQKGKGYLDKIIFRISKMYNLIEGILQFSRVGLINHTPSMIKTYDFFQEFVKEIDTPSPYKIEISEDLPDIYYDPIYFEQIIKNLLDNAIKHHGKDNGHIWITGNKKQDFWEFCIRDDGIGIEKNHHRRIFRLFQQLNTSDNISIGIGLSLVKKIIEESGGSIWVESIPNVGSSFFFTIKINT